MKNILVVTAHSDFSKSLVTKTVLADLKAWPHQGELRNLNDLYPDFNIDTEAEQKALLKADIIVLQFPFHWYSVPGIMKHWLDKVFTFGFAYGSVGDKLKGKKLILSFTIGGPQDSYQPLGYNHFPIAELLKPLMQTAYLAQLDLQEPVYSHGMVYIPGVYNVKEEVEERAHQHAQRLIRCLTDLQNA